MDSFLFLELPPPTSLAVYFVRSAYDFKTNFTTHFYSVCDHNNASSTLNNEVRHSRKFLLLLRLGVNCHCTISVLF